MAAVLLGTARAVCASESVCVVPASSASCCPCGLEFACSQPAKVLQGQVLLHSFGCHCIARRPVAHWPAVYSFCSACLSSHQTLLVMPPPPSPALHALLICWQQLLHAQDWAAGTLKLASLVQYVPLPVVGGYLGYVGYFCFASGASVATGERNISSHGCLCRLLSPGKFLKSPVLCLSPRARS